MSNIDLIYAACLHKVWGISLNNWFIPILKYYGTWQDFWEKENSAKPPLQIQPSLWEKLLLEKKKISPHAVADELIQKGIGLICKTDVNFSRLLLQIYNIPCILYYRGDLSLLRENALAIVGARKASSYGLRQGQMLAEELAQHDLVIVSGLARGIDQAAHQGALNASGKTIAVLGSGIDVLYPPEARILYEKIAEKGLVISEFPLKTPPLSYNFPLRNRIISGLSLGVFVVEAEAQSGSLITADFALEQGREVFALPGPVTNPLSIGPLRLIQNGAKLVIYARDILEELGFIYQESLFTKKQEKISNVSTHEKALLSLLSWEPVHIDTLLQKEYLDQQNIYHLLLTLEIKGLIKQLPGKYYVKI